MKSQHGKITLPQYGSRYFSDHITEIFLDESFDDPDEIEEDNCMSDSDDE